jgi:hypothetical protein
MQLLKARGGRDSDSGGVGGGEAPAHRKAAAGEGGGAARDAGSEGAASGSTAADSSMVSEYGRGRRLRKLMRLLSSKAALQTVMGFRIKVIVLSLAIMAVHMGAFGAVLGFISKQSTLMGDVAAAGEAVDVMHRVASLTLVLDAAERGYGFGAADTKRYAVELDTEMSRCGVCGLFGWGCVLAVCCDSVADQRCASRVLHLPLATPVPTHAHTTGSAT